MKKLLLTTALFVSIAPAAFAGGLTQGWGGEASLSGSTTSGNTDTKDIGLALHVTKDADIWKHSFDTTFDFGEISEVQSKNRMYFGYQLDREINDKLYAYGNANYYSDEFGPFKNGSFLGAGLGYQAIKTEPMQWALEGGAGYRTQKTRPVGMVPGENVGEFALRGGSDFDYKLNENVSLFNNSEVIWSDADTYIWNDIGITANLAGNLAARASFRFDTHSDVPAGTEKTDTISRISLVYTMK